MSKVERGLMFAAVTLMGVVFVFPIWNIEICAPQYPEGLSMQIGVNEVTGNLSQINLLNHYIGMKQITPAAIPELRIMPWLLAAMIALGLIVALMGSRRAVMAWLGALIAMACAGLFDFWRWGYEYGHELSPEAPIKVAGMSYQPPLFGHKQLLNIDAYSYPHVGAWAMAAAGSLALLAIYWPRLHLSEETGRALSRVSLFLILLSSLTGCKVSPSPLLVGRDTCDGCHMLITSDRFGGEVITDKGRTYKFDSLPCLMRFVRSLEAAPQAVLVTDYLAPGVLVDARRALYLKSERFTDPMGGGVVASSDSSGLGALKSKLSGDLVEWNALSSSF